MCYKGGSISTHPIWGGRDTELPKPSRTLLGVVDSPIEPTLLANYARQWIGNYCPFTPLHVLIYSRRVAEILLPSNAAAFIWCDEVFHVIAAKICGWIYTSERLLRPAMEF